MTTSLRTIRLRKAPAIIALGLALAAGAAPLAAQDNGEARLRRVEAEVRALQRKVFPEGAGRTFSADMPAPAGSSSTAAPVPASSAMTDTLVRLDALEAQIAKLTAQQEENTNRINRIEGKLGLAASATDPATSAGSGPAPALAPATAPVATASPAPSASPTPAATASPAPRPVASTPPAAAPDASPSAQRLAAVRAVVKPQTDDPGDDEYSYGFRLWEGRFYPEAQQQLKLMIERYPRHARISYARNLLGRAYLDDGNAKEAGAWFLQNYQADKRGARAPDSLLFLAESMRRMKDTSRACIALAEFTDTFPAEAAGRLKSSFDQTRAGVKCN